MKRRQILALLVCFMFLFSSLAVYADTTETETQTETQPVTESAPVVQDEGNVANTTQNTNSVITVKDAVYQTPEEIVIALTEDEEAAKFANFEGLAATIAQEQSVVKSTYMFKKIDNKNILKIMLKIKAYVLTKDGYYKMEMVKLKTMTFLKKDIVAKKALVKIQGRYFAQKAIDFKVHAKLMEINNYVKQNSSKLTAEQKKVVAKELKPLLAKVAVQKAQMAAMQKKMAGLKAKYGLNKVKQQPVKELKNKVEKPAKELIETVEKPVKELKDKVERKAKPERKLPLKKK